MSGESNAVSNQCESGSDAVAGAAVFTGMLHAGRITPHFQPIIDLHSATVLGFEILSRGIPPFEMPLAMFREAERLGLQWELELACRRAAIRRVGSLPERYQRVFYFLNVSPKVFSDTRFVNGFSQEELSMDKFSMGRIVIEITEASSVADYGTFEVLIRHYVNQGFKVALDDFGAGHSGLITLVAMAPHFLKLDRALVSDIQDHPYKQKLVKAIVSFAAAVETHVIAEGIETEEELRTVFRLGVRYAQGFYFARPAPDPCELGRDQHAVIVQLSRRYNPSPDMAESSTARHISRPVTLQVGGTTCEHLDHQFRSQPRLDHVVVVDGQAPVGLITRQGFYIQLGHRYGYSVFQNRDVGAIMKPSPLTVGEGIELAVLGNLAMNRDLDELYDPVIVTDREGRLIGTITMKQLIFAVIDLEVKVAAAANPLTRLPGNMLIQSWLNEALSDPPFTIIYADLDNFKGYNDAYGFTQGDLMIKLTANVLNNHLLNLSPNARLGHVGGDDFIMVLKGDLSEEALLPLCHDFDRNKLNLFNIRDVERGIFTTMNRRGEKEDVPLVTLSLAVLTQTNLSPIPHHGEIGQLAASLKRKVKACNVERGRSGYLIDRRDASRETFGEGIRRST